MKTRRVVLMEAGVPISTTVAKLRSLGALADCEPHLLYWDRGDSPAAYPLASEIPKGQVHRIWQPETRSCGRLFPRLRVAGRSRRLLRSLDPWCVQSSALDMLLAAFMAVRPPGGFVFDLQDTRDWMHRWWTRPVIRALLDRTRLVTVTSPRFESHFLRRHRLISPRQRVICVPNPVERSRFGDYRPRATDGDLVVGYIGTFRGAGAIQSLADAVGQVRRQGADWRVFFAGVGPELPLVEALCRRNEYINYGGPFDQSRDLARLYGRANVVYALYDDSEDKRIHWPCRMGEAVFARLPIIVATGSFMAELVEEHNLGFAVPLGDSEALAALLLRLAQDRSVFRDIAGSDCRAEPMFGYEHYESEFVAAFRALLDQPGSTASG